jgi:hypothetical protein
MLCSKCNERIYKVGLYNEYSCWFALGILTASFVGNKDWSDTAGQRKNECLKILELALK